jgi:hypothetical protein
VDVSHGKLYFGAGAFLGAVSGESLRPAFKKFFATNAVIDGAIAADIPKVCQVRSLSLRIKMIKASQLPTGIWRD